MSCACIMYLEDWHHISNRAPVCKMSLWGTKREETGGRQGLRRRKPDLITDESCPTRTCGLSSYKRLETHRAWPCPFVPRERVAGHSQGYSSKGRGGSGLLTPHAAPGPRGAVGRLGCQTGWWAWPRGPNEEGRDLGPSWSLGPNSCQDPLWP